MDVKSKLTKEVVAQESRFILDSLLNAGQFAKEAPFEELRRLCEQSISLRMMEYIGFLERFGYVTHDRSTSKVNITADGERVVAGEKLAELVVDVVHHFRPVLSRTRTREESVSVPTVSSVKRGAVEGKEILDERYEKIKPIGSGGIGTVYLARQAQLNRAVALKEMRELFSFFTEPQRLEIMRRFEEEVLKASKLFHPNIAIILDGNTSRDFPYIVSEYLSGGNLRRILKQAQAIPPELALRVLLQILHALGHAHGLGVVHRGLKPENILFDSSGNVRITDFGLARVVERDQAVIQHVYVGVGSVAYMAPELFVDQSRVGPQSDLYAAGIILYEMLARKLPGRRSPMPTQIHSGLPKVIDDVFDRLTQDEAEDRYKSVEEVLQDLAKAEVARAFAEPQQMIFFWENPLAKLNLMPEEDAAPEGATVPFPGKTPSFDPDAPMIMASPSSEVDPLAKIPSVPLMPSISGSLTPSKSEERFLAAEDLSDGGSDPDMLSDSGEPGKRRRVNRPYSFQQRLKDKDK